MKISHSFRLALVPGLIVAACLCWAASKPKQLSSYDPEVKALLARMTLDEKIGQMTQPEQNALEGPGRHRELLPRLAVLSGGSSDPKDRQQPGGLDRSSYDRYQARTRKTRLKIPILYGIDAVHGHNNVLGAVIFPHNIGLGCTRNADAGRAGRSASPPRRSAPPASSGPSRPASPCRRTIRWGRTYEGFCEDPAAGRASSARPAVRGLPGRRPRRSARRAGLRQALRRRRRHGVRHAHATASGLDQGDTRVDEATLRAHPPAGLHRGHRGRRRHHHAVLQQLERREDARAASACSPTS